MDRLQLRILPPGANQANGLWAAVRLVIAYAIAFGVCAGAVDVFFAAVFLTAVLFAAFADAVFAAAFFRAGDGAFFAAAFAFAALAALAFFKFATSFAFAAAESFRFGFGGSGVAASAWTLEAAHLLRCASAIAFRPAALIFRRLRLVGSGVAADSAGPDSMDRSSAIWPSIRRFCDSKPSMAAAIIWSVSLCVGM